MKIMSRAFENGESIPKRYTCEGDNISPPLEWIDVPGETVSLALILEDPDAPDPRRPQGIWTHWLLYNIPTTCHGFEENARSSGLPKEILEGMNDWGGTGYRGPCPPIGRHRYYFRLFALDCDIQEKYIPTRDKLMIVFQKHVVEEANLIGTYEKHK